MYCLEEVHICIYIIYRAENTEAIDTESFNVEIVS